MISRVDALTQSVQDHIRSFLVSAGYSSFFVINDDYPPDRANPLDKTIVVIGHDQTDPTKDGEIGGPLAFEPVMYHCDVLGKDHRTGRNIASLIKEKLESGAQIPLYDYSFNPPVVADQIPYVDGVIHTRLTFPNPYPWQQHWNLVTFSITLEYNRSAL